MYVTLWSWARSLYVESKLNIPSSCDAHPKTGQCGITSHVSLVLWRGDYLAVFHLQYNSKTGTIHARVPGYVSEFVLETGQDSKNCYDALSYGSSSKGLQVQITYTPGVRANVNIKIVVGALPFFSSLYLKVVTRIGKR